MPLVRLFQIIPAPPDGEQLTDDIGRMLAAILCSDARLASALGDSMRLPSMDAQQFIEQTAEWCKSCDAASFAIMVNEREAVGQLSISRLKDADGQGRIGYWLASGYWHKRIMSEAFRQALAIAKSYRLKVVSGHVPADNVASEKLWLRHGAKGIATDKGQEFTIIL